MSVEITDELCHLMMSIESGNKDFYTNLHPDKLYRMAKLMIDCPEKPENFELEKFNFKGSEDRICLTSGGADSTIFWLKAGKPRGLYVDIGQPYADKELNALHDLGVEFDRVHFIVEKFSWSKWKHIIPGRNLLFLTAAADIVKDGGTILFSVISGEGYTSGKGDKSLKFIEMFRHWYRAVTGKIVFVETMDSRTKGQWLEYMLMKNLDINLIRHKTVTCFSATSKGKPQCGRCQACFRKYLSFMHIQIDTAEDYEIHPMIGGQMHADKYKKVLREALDKNKHSHYSLARCKEDLAAIHAAEKLMEKSV